jgi:hypothetical protein
MWVRCWASSSVRAVKCSGKESHGYSHRTVLRERRRSLASARTLTRALSSVSVYSVAVHQAGAE